MIIREDLELRRCEVCKALRVHQRIHSGDVLLFICCLCAVNKVYHQMLETQREQNHVPTDQTFSREDM